MQEGLLSFWFSETAYDTQRRAQCSKGSDDNLEYCRWEHDFLLVSGWYVSAQWKIRFRLAEGEKTPIAHQGIIYAFDIYPTKLLERTSLCLAMLCAIIAINGKIWVSYLTIFVKIRKDFECPLRPCLRNALLIRRFQTSDYRITGLHLNFGATNRRCSIFIIY